MIIIRVLKDSGIETGKFSFVSWMKTVNSFVRCYHSTYTIDDTEWGNDYDLEHQLKCL